MAHFEEIDYIRRKLYISKFQNELDFLKENDMAAVVEDEDNWMTERSNQLEKIISTLEKEQKEPSTDTKESIFDEVEKYMFKKPWNRMSLFHRMAKINEYLNEHMDDDAVKKDLSKKFSKEINDKKLGTKKYVEYDPKEEKILSIPCLIYNEDTNSYSIKTNM